MDIHLCCPHCPCRFSSAPDAPAAEVLDRMNGDAPWFALAEGKTFEDMVFAALGKRGKILCPDCRAEVLVGGESLLRSLSDNGRKSPQTETRTAGDGSEAR
jgi:hypothetical protein